MPALDAARLRKWADELDAEERGERETALEAKVDRLETQLASTGLSEDDRRLLTEAQERLAALEAADDPDDPDDSGGSPGVGAGETHPPAPNSSPKKKTRPGRKSGAAYDWTVDDDGHVQHSDVAVIYTGADEDDEVELEDDE